MAVTHKFRSGTTVPTAALFATNEPAWDRTGKKLYIKAGDGTMTCINPVATPADDSLVVHIAGTETITGAKTFSNQVTATAIQSTEFYAGTNSNNRIRTMNSGLNLEIFTVNTGYGAVINGFGGGRLGINNTVNPSGWLDVRTDTYASKLLVNVAGRTLLNNPTDDGSSTLQVNGDAAIGGKATVTSSNTAPFVVNSSTGNSAVYLNSVAASGNLYLGFQSAGATKLLIGWQRSDDAMLIYNAGAASVIASLTQAGAFKANKLGVGAMDLSAALDIQGTSATAYSAGGLGTPGGVTASVYNLDSTVGSYAQILLANRGSNAGFIRIVSESKGSLNSDLVITNQGTERLRMTSAGAFTFTGTGTFNGNNAATLTVGTYNGVVSPYKYDMYRNTGTGWLDITGNQSGYTGYNFLSGSTPLVTIADNTSNIVTINKDYGAIKITSGAVGDFYMGWTPYGGYGMSGNSTSSLVMIAGYYNSFSAGIGNILASDWTRIVNAANTAGIYLEPSMDTVTVKANNYSDLGDVVCRNLTTTGSVTGPNLNTYVATRTLGAAVNDYVELGTVSHSDAVQPPTIRVEVRENGSGQSGSHVYMVSMSYDGTAGIWHQVMPISSSGPRGGSYVLEVKGSAGATIYLRMRRLTASSSGAPLEAMIYLQKGCSYTSTSATGNETSPSSTIAPSAVATQVGGSLVVGRITNDASGDILQVVGSASITTSGHQDTFTSPGNTTPNLRLVNDGSTLAMHHHYYPSQNIDRWVWRATPNSAAGVSTPKDFAIGYLYGLAYVETNMSLMFSGAAMNLVQSSNLLQFQPNAASQQVQWYYNSMATTETSMVWSSNNGLVFDNGTSSNQMALKMGTTPGLYAGNTAGIRFSSTSAYSGTVDGLIKRSGTALIGLNADNGVEIKNLAGSSYASLAAGNTTVNGSVTATSNAIINGKMVVGQTAVKTPVVDIVLGQGSGTSTVNDAASMRLRHSATDGNSMSLYFGVTTEGKGGANQGHAYIQPCYWGGSYLNPLALCPMGGQVIIGAAAAKGTWSSATLGTVGIMASSNGSAGALGGKIAFTANNYLGEQAFIAGSYDGTYFFQGQGLVFYTASGTDVAGADAAVERLKIRHDGRILVNQATDNGTDALQVKGNMTLSAASGTPYLASAAGLDLKAASGNWVTLYAGTTATFGARGGGYDGLMFNGARLGFDTGTVGVGDTYIGRFGTSELGVYSERSGVGSTLGKLRSANQKIQTSAAGYTPDHWLSSGNTTLGASLYLEYTAAGTNNKIKLIAADGSGLSMYRMADGGGSYVSGTPDLNIDNSGVINAGVSVKTPAMRFTTGAVVGYVLKCTNVDGTLALQAESGGGGGVTDGDKGDITVSSSGTVWTIDNSAVTLAKIANIATATFLGRNTASSGVVEELSVATAKTMLGLTGTNSGDQTITLTGDVTGSGTGSFATTIAANVVTFAKMQQVSTQVILGRDTAGTGNIEAMAPSTIKTMLQLSGTNTGDQTITLTGDVTGSGTSSFAATIGNNVVTLAKMATMATASFLGRNTVSTGNVEVLSAATVKTMLNLTGTNSGDQTITLTGDVTGSGTGSFAATIGNNVVTLAKFQTIATASILGRTTASTGNVEVLSAAQVVGLILPTQTGNSGKVLSTDGTNLSWIAAGGSGTVTSVSVVTANGVSGSVATATTTPAITLTLGAITPTSVNGLTLTPQATGFTIAGGTSSRTLTVPSNATVSGSNTGDQTITLTGDVTGSGIGSFAATIANNAVTLAKMATMATASFLGRNTAGTGNVEVLSVATAKTLLNLTGTNSGDQTITLTSDVTGSGTGSFATTIAAGVVTNTKLANVATETLKGRTTSGTGSPEDLTPKQARKVLRRAAFTIATPGSSYTLDITDGLFQSATLTTNWTLNFPTVTPEPGETVFIYVKQPSSGGPYTLTLGSGFEAPGGRSTIVLSTTNNAKDRIEIFFDSTTTATVSITKDIKA